MSTVSDIITQAYRESNLIAANASPTPTETTEALARLQALVLSVLGNEVGYIMEDWNVTDTAITRPNGIPLPSLVGFTVRPNARLICNLAAPLTVLLDPQPQDGQRFSVVDASLNFATHSLTIDPNGRKLDGAVAALALNTVGEATQWFYRSDTADWVVISPLASDDNMPFPADFDDFFIIMLASRLNPRHGRSLGEESAMRLSQQRDQFISRYTQTRVRMQGSDPQTTGA